MPAGRQNGFSLSLVFLHTFVRNLETPQEWSGIHMYKVLILQYLYRYLACYPESNTRVCGLNIENKILALTVFLNCNWSHCVKLLQFLFSNKLCIYLNVIGLGRGFKNAPKGKCRVPVCNRWREGSLVETLSAGFGSTFWSCTNSVINWEEEEGGEQSKAEKKKK